jgi:hypothetical protein
MPAAHRFIQHRHALGRPASRDQRSALPEPPERLQIGVAESVRGLGDLDKGVARGLGVSALQGPQRHGETKVPMLHAVQRRILEEVLRPRQPASAAGKLAALDEGQPEPECAPYRGRNLASFQEGVMGPLPGVVGCLELTDKVCSSCQPVEIIGLERVLLVGGGQELVRVPPRQLFVRLAALREWISGGHRCSQ